MPARAFAATMMLLLAFPAPQVAAAGDVVSAAVTSAALATPPTDTRADDTAPDDTAPQDTVNEFLPEERGLGECISAVPKPGCGSRARGGWRQGLVFLAIVAGLGVIAWRVVASSRRARRDAVNSRRMPDATSARVEPDGDRGP